jgi:hypothetical protein
MKNLINQVFNRLTVVEFSYKDNKNIFWKCKCICGKENVIVSSSNLLNGNTQSCGCLAKEKLIIRNKKYNQYNLSGEYGIGYTSKGEEFYFDLEDYNKIKDYCWIYTKSGYVVTRNNKETIYFHKYVMNTSNELEVDHINRIKSDNRKLNLRPCTIKLNSQNKSLGTNNKSGIIGVYFCNTKNRWVAKIKLNRKTVKSKYFKNKDDAIKFRLLLEKQYFKDGFEPQRHLFEQYNIK